jgi:hypothetical protein
MPPRLHLFSYPFFAPDDGGGDGGAAGSGAPEQSGARTYTEEYVRALRAESAGYRTRAKALDEQLAGIRKAFSIPDGQDPDWTKVLSDHEATHKTALEAAEKNAKQALLRAEVRAMGAELGVVDADVVWQLVDLSKAQIADDGKITGVKEAIEALLKDKPFLKAATAGKSGGVGAPGGNPGPTGAPDPVEAAKKLAEERNKGKTAPAGGYDPWATK